MNWPLKKVVQWSASEVVSLEPELHLTGIILRRLMYTVLDIETTGGKYNERGITEIAIHKFDGHEVVDKFISLVNPEKEIQPFVVKLTGINSKDASHCT